MTWIWLTTRLTIKLDTEKRISYIRVVIYIISVFFRLDSNNMKKKYWHRSLLCFPLRKTATEREVLKELRKGGFVNSAIMHDDSWVKSAWPLVLRVQGFQANSMVKAMYVECVSCVSGERRMAGRKRTSAAHRGLSSALPTMTSLPPAHQPGSSMAPQRPTSL